MNIHPDNEKTFVLVKPDAVRRGLVGEIISRFESRGLKVIALEMVWADHKMIDDHYPKDEEWTRRLGVKTLKTYQQYGYDAVKELGTKDPGEIGVMVREWLITFMTSGPMVKMVVQGVHAVDMVRKLVGDTMPSLAEMGTIRGDYSIDSPTSANMEKRAVYNLVHASENQEEARHEISYWFEKGDLYEYKLFAPRRNYAICKRGLRHAV